MSRMATLGEVELTTSAGPLVLRNLSAYVEESNRGLEGRSDNRSCKFWGIRLMNCWYTCATPSQNGIARAIGGDWDQDRIQDTAVTRACRLQSTALIAIPSPTSDDVERYDTRAAMPTLAVAAKDKVIATLQGRRELAEDMGLEPEARATLGQILERRADSFRLAFGHDPPVKVEPLLVRLKTDAIPIKAQVRRMPPNDLCVPAETCVLATGGRSGLQEPCRWASAPRIVRTKEQDHDPTADPRMTIDERGVDERSEPMPWPMSILEVVVGELEGARVFFVPDWFRGYWQLPLHPDCQKYFTFVTHRGMYTPTRVPMGATDSVAYCQQVVEEIFVDLIGQGILCWLDDMLGYHEAERATPL